MGFHLEAAAKDPRQWRAEAMALQNAYLVLLREWLAASGSAGGIAFPAFMLAGYAIEDLAKARILELGADWDPRKGHDLPMLVARAGIAVHPHERCLLERLMETVKWAGRYPAPLNSSDSKFPRHVTDGDFDMIERIVERLRQSARDPRSEVDEAELDSDGDSDDVGD